MVVTKGASWAIILHRSTNPLLLENLKIFSPKSVTEALYVKGEAEGDLAGTVSVPPAIDVSAESSDPKRVGLEGSGAGPRGAQARVNPGVAGGDPATATALREPAHLAPALGMRRRRTS
ncbi:unnamed protein product [Rangifer tarandus platyrhynchus]|uniref:Uncharacterized protein n=1 Tax=Rangifer tarandus platyrhynchus TaxID=3082113 RepID=A0AC59ZRU6_RANTA